MRVKNNMRDAIDLIVRGAPKDGQAPTKSIPPGETVEADFVDSRMAVLIEHGHLQIEAAPIVGAQIALIGAQTTKGE